MLPYHLPRLYNTPREVEVHTLEQVWSCKKYSYKHGMLNTLILNKVYAAYDKKTVQGAKCQA